MTERIQKTEEFLREKLAESPFFVKYPEKGAYRLEHSFRVARIAGEIARTEGMDEEAMTIAGLLHDVSYCREFTDHEDWKNHGRDAARIARPFLRTLGLPEETVEAICYGLAIHVDDEADFPGERTPFVLTVGDADNIDRFDAYRIYETLEGRRFSGLSLAEKTACVDETLARLARYAAMSLSTDTATALWRERIGFYRDYYTRLARQLRAGGGFSGEASCAGSGTTEMDDAMTKMAGEF